MCSSEFFPKMTVIFILQNLLGFLCWYKMFIKKRINRNRNLDQFPPLSPTYEPAGKRQDWISA